MEKEMSYRDMQRELKARGLSARGTKEDLMKRLKDSNATTTTSNNKTSDMSCDELRTELTSRGFSCKGNKADLMNRLQGALGGDDIGTTSENKRKMKNFETPENKKKRRHKLLLKQKKLLQFGMVE